MQCYLECRSSLDTQEPYFFPLRTLTYTIVDRDTGSFGSLQALPSFLSRFGVAGAAGTYKLPAARKSMMNSFPWIGKFIGCFSAEPLIEKLGYKKAMYIAAALQIIAIISKFAHPKSVAMPISIFS